MRRAHVMPFGAELAGGAVRFRLWAPASREVTLLLGRDHSREAPMQRLEGGWHELRLHDTPAGTPYAFKVDDAAPVPDPASRFNPWDANGPSVVVDPRAFDWTDDAWRGRPWREAVVYEVHVGTFTREGTFTAAVERLDHLADTGITAIEIMPVADFPGARNWGYDGVLPFAPESSYGTPGDFKRLVNEAHARGIMVLLDVVYNHFGPEGNHVTRYAPQFMNDAHQTPWGAAMNFDGEGSRPVRDFFLHNALYWIEEFHLDGLRLDAVHAIADETDTHIVCEIARAIADGPGRDRHVHMVLENEHNDASLLARDGARATAQWNDPWHHGVHVLATGESDGYYGKFTKDTARLLARSFAEGFDASLPYDAFMPFLQNHDQVGNRAMGERLASLASPEALRLATAALLIMPQIPLLFMGDEIRATTPFLFFTDFHGELADAVRKGRRKEFAAFPRFASDEARERIPDPNAESTFVASKMRWEDADREWLGFFRALLALRAGHIVPRLAGSHRGARFESSGKGGVSVDWTLGDASILRLRANFSGEAAPSMKPPPGATLHTEGSCDAAGGLAPWSGVWTLEAAR